MKTVFSLDSLPSRGNRLVSCRSVGAALLLTVCAWPAVARPPNLIFFLVDDMGWMDCGAYGSRYYETPNIDRLATQSMRFTQAYAQPLCSPTRASILTGQYSSRHGVTSATGHRPPQPPGYRFLPQKAAPNVPYLMPESKNYLDPELTTLAEVLRKAGYRTGHFGKWHLGLMPQHWPEQQGFETVWHCAPDPGPPNYFSPYGVAPSGTPDARHHVGTITDGPPGEHITDRLTDEALRFIEAHKDEPFYLNLWHYSVHGPWQHKEAYTAAFAKKRDPRDKQRNPVMASMLKNVDESLGRIMRRLDELGLAENTVLVFTSDNGGNCHSWSADDPKLRKITKAHPLYETIQRYRKWAGGEVPTNNDPLRDGKGRLYEGGIRVPLMVRWPGRIRAGSTSDSVVGCIDFFPTLLALLKLKSPSSQNVDGESFAPVLLDTGVLSREAYFIWFPHLVPGVAVRKGDWKLIRRFQERPQDYDGLYELFNLKEDLGETRNLAASMPEKVRELDALIDAFVRETGALCPRRNPACSPMQGLVPKFCEAVVTNGLLRVSSSAQAPFLGTAQIQAEGPLVLKLRVRAARGGSAKVQWFCQGQEGFPKTGQVVPFTISAGSAWQDIEVALPVQGTSQIIRLYLPAQKAPVDISDLRYLSGKNGKPIRVWRFGDGKIPLDSGRFTGVPLVHE